MSELTNRFADSARSADSATEYLEVEIAAVTDAAEIASTVAQKLGRSLSPLTLAVGSTPTAQTASEIPPELVKALGGATLEIHAGVYPLLDLQQRATGTVAGDDDYALGVVARVCSTYPQRGPPQVLIDAGAIAFSKDTGPAGHFGEVYSAGPLKGWRVTKTSQASPLSHLSRLQVADTVSNRSTAYCRLLLA